MMQAREITAEPDIDWATGPESDTPPDEQPNPQGPKIRSIADLPSPRTYAAQKIEYVIEGILAAGTVTLVAGDSGCGKSTLVTAMANSVERGVPFAGLQTQRRQVLILDKENPLAIVIERLDRLGIDVSETFKIWGGWCEEEPPDPGSLIVVEWVRGCDPKPVIIVDSLIAFFEGDENNASEVRPYMHAFRRLADIGATIVVLHHPGKGDSSRDYRGSSDIKASIDVGYKLTNLGDPFRLSTLRLAAFKARFTVATETVINYRNGEFSIDSRNTSETNEEILRALLIANPGIKAAEFENLAAEKGARRNRARQFLADAIVAGRVRVEKGPNNKRFHHWETPSREAEACP